MFDGVYSGINKKNRSKTVVWTRLHFDRGIRGLFDGVYSEINEKNGSKTIVWTTLHFDSNEIYLKDQAYFAWFTSTRGIVMT